MIHLCSIWRNACQASKYLLLAPALYLSISSLHAQPVDWLWARRAGGSGGYDRGLAVARGMTGDCYVAGYYTSPTATVAGCTNSVTLTNTDNGRNIFLAKYTPGGELLWAQGIGGITIPFHFSSVVGVSAMAIDTADNLYLTGNFHQYAVFGTSNAVTLSSGNNQSLYVARFAADGSLVWAQQGQGFVPASGQAIRVDDQGSVYVAGTFGSGSGVGEQDLTLGQGEDAVTLPTLNQKNIFLAKFHPDGHLLWAQSAGGSEPYLDDFVVDHSHNMYLSGYFYGSLTIGFGTNALTTTNEDLNAVNYFLAKLDPVGGLLRVTDQSGCLAVGSDNALYVASTYTTDLTLGSGPDAVTLTNLGSEDVYLTKYTPEGHLVWARSACGAGDDWPTGMAIDSVDNLFLSGSFGYGTAGTAPAGLRFDDGEHAAQLWSAGTNQWGSSASDAFVVSYNSSGGLRWALRAGGTDSDSAAGVASDGADGCYVTGFFTQSATFGDSAASTTLANDVLVAANQDGFVARVGFRPRFAEIARVQHGEVQVSVTGSPGFHLPERNASFPASSRTRPWVQWTR